MSKVNKPHKTGLEAWVVADHLHSAAIHLLRLVRRQDSRSREGPARLSALSVLVFAGPQSLGQLAAAEQVKPPTMTRIVSGLEKSRLAERVADPLDGRRIRIRATPKGTRLLQAARRRRISALAELFSSFSGSELETLQEAAALLEEGLGGERNR